MSNLPPSRAARRMVCPGSRALENKFPAEIESHKVLEGKTAHWYAHELIKCHITHCPPPAGIAPFGNQVTNEMFDGAMMYLQDVIDTIGISPILKYGIEQSLPIYRIHPECRGAPDLWVLIPNELHIWDYKFGHKYVEVFENWQLIEYAAGILEYLEINGKKDQYLQVTFHIVQPRCFQGEPTRTWSLKASDLRAYFNTLEASETIAMTENAPCNPTPECNFCSARHACGALQNAVLTRIDAPMINTNNLNAQQTGALLKQTQLANELFTALESGLQEQARAMITRGERVPGFKLANGQGSQQWTKTPAEIIEIGAMFDKDLSKPASVITPKQAIKLGVPESTVKSFSQVIPGALKLVAENPLEIQKVFGGAK